MTTFSETTLPALIFTVPAGNPKGNVPALGTLTVNEAQGQDQDWLTWGVETNEAYDITAATANLFYEAEARTVLSGSSVITLSGSSGGGTNNAIESIALAPSMTSIWSTQASGGGAHLTHVGQFRVWARVMNTASSVGSVSLRLDWGAGDLTRYTSNDTTTLSYTAASTFSLVDLGIVNIPAVKAGPQRWEGRIAASATNNDTLRVDCVFLVPIDLGSGEATALPDATSALAIYDPFAQSAGSLAGKVTPVGAATWTFVSGDTDDWTIDTTNQWAIRSATADTARRVMKAGTTAFASHTASLDMMFADSLASLTGLVLRLVDSNNYLRVGVDRGSNQLLARQFVAGVDGLLASVGVGATSTSTWYTLTCSIDTTGLLRVWWNVRGATLGIPNITATGVTSLKTGGALASGSAGIFELVTTSTSNRTLDNFTVLTPAVTDAVAYANQSVQIRHDVVQREDSTGTFWQPVGTYEGDLLRVPVTGREGRSVRFIVKASRNVPGVGADSAIDDINATLTVTPRYLSVPAAT